MIRCEKCGQIRNKNEHICPIKVWNKGLYNVQIGSNKGRHFSKEWKQNISKAKKGKISSFKGKYHTIETRMQLSKQHLGMKYSIETKKKLSLLRKGKNNSFFGKHHSLETRKKLSEYRKNKSNLYILKEKNPNWKGGISSLERQIRELLEYKIWRQQIFIRDGFICQDCFQKGGKLEVHHIKPFSIILKEFLQQYNQFSPIEDKETLVRLAITYEPFWDLLNGITFCKKYHRNNFSTRINIWMEC